MEETDGIISNNAIASTLNRRLVLPAISGTYLSDFDFEPP